MYLDQRLSIAILVISSDIIISNNSSIKPIIEIGRYVDIFCEFPTLKTEMMFGFYKYTMIIRIRKIFDL